MKRQIMGLALAVALLGAGQAQALLIDDYSDSNLPQTCDAYGSKATGQCVAQPDFFTTSTPNLDTGLANVVGGSRHLDILQTSGALSPSAGANVNGVDGLLYNNGSSVTSKLTMTYDANGSGLGGGAGVDLTSNTLPATFADGSPTPGGPAEYLRWQITSMDINLLATVILTDADGTTAGNAFLKLPSGATAPAFGLAAGVCTTTSLLVCVQPSVPGALYHSFAAFNAGGIDPATGVSFFDDPYSAGSLAPSGGDGDLDFDAITKIVVIFDTSSNTGTDGLDLTETCFDTVPLLGTPVANPPGVALPGNNIGSSVCSSAIPEPSTVLLMGTGLLGVGLLGVRSRFSRRRRQA